MKLQIHAIALSITILSLWSNPINAQQSKVDSLKLELNNTTNSDLISTLIELSWYYKSIAVDTSLIYAKQAVKLAAKESPVLKAEANNSLGNAYQALAQYDSAMVYINKSITYKLHQTDSTDLAISLNNRGIIFDEMGEYDNALASYFQGLEVAKAKRNKLTEAT